MKSVPRAAAKLAVFAIAMVIFYFGIAQAIQRPVAGETTSYTARFTDANGLKTGDDVRMFGVQVGKVEWIELDNSIAEIGFTLQRDRVLYLDTRLAIRYQSLTGQRYVDVQQPDSAADPLPAEASIGTDKTIPSFDITTLFNGLQPVLAEFSPSALNQFAENMLAVIEGNDAGLGPALDSIETLSSYVSDRQAVLSALVSNLRQISDQIGSRSTQLITLISGIADIFTALQEKIDGVVDFAITAPPVLRPLDSLLSTLGLTTDVNNDFDDLVNAAFPDPDEALDVLGRLPGLLQGLNALVPATGTGVDLTCSNGESSPPAPLQVLLGGQRISICAR